MYRRPAPLSHDCGGGRSSFAASGVQGESCAPRQPEVSFGRESGTRDEETEGNSNAILQRQNSSKIRACNPYSLRRQQAREARRLGEPHAPTDAASALRAALLVADSVIRPAHGGCVHAGWVQISSGSSSF